MRNRFNTRLLLWGLGVIQPASLEEVVAFLQLIYPDVSQWPSGDDLDMAESKLLNLNYIIATHKKSGLYSLTAHANQNMDVKLRKSRDKARITLLKEIYDASLNMSEVVDIELDGVSPSIDVSSITQDGSRQISTPADSPLKSQTIGRTYWPRISGQLNLKVGLEFHPSDNFFKYCSFPNIKLVHQASGQVTKDKDITLSELGLCIGISPRLLTTFIHKPENHYRKFSIGKKGGGERIISSPRFFLKTIQYWIKSYFLVYLKIHTACHAYQKGRSIISNAKNHVDKDFVANIDVENFFGNIKKIDVFNLLIRHKFGQNLANSLSSLVTLDGCIPQGAPTSPVISNAYLFDMDEALSKESKLRELTYTRYADDITISGNSKEAVLEIVHLCSELLKNYRLRLNDKKTRIASRGGSQRVTGVVVNKKLQPPREYQRRVRAIFHKAFNNPEQYIDKVNELRGHLSYLSSFDTLKETRHLRRYKMVLNKLTAVANKK